MTRSFGACPCSRLAMSRDDVNRSEMFPRCVEWLSSIVSIYVCRIRTYHIAKNASNSRSKCVLPITSQKYLLSLKKRNISKKDTYPLVSSKKKRSFVTFLMNITSSKFQFLKRRNMVVSPSIGLLIAGVASGIFIFISLRAK